MTKTDAKELCRLPESQLEDLEYEERKNPYGWKVPMKIYLRAAVFEVAERYHRRRLQGLATR